MHMMRRSFLVSIVLLWTTLLLSTVQAQQCPKVLLATNSRNTIQQGESIDYGGIVLVQQFGGNLQVYTGRPDRLWCLIWESKISEFPSNAAGYNTTIRANSALVTTRRGLQESTFFSVGGNQAIGNYYFIVNCDGTVGIYRSSVPSTESAVWTERRNQCGLPNPCQRTVFLSSDERVVSGTPKQGVGAYYGNSSAFIQQENNGNVVVKSGTPAAPGATLWQSCDTNNALSRYFTALQGDSQFITRPSSNENTWVWKRDDFVANTSKKWELALTCKNNAYDKLVISDPTGLTVAWEDDLRPSCNAPPVCPSAITLLKTGERIWSSTIRDVGQEYLLQQRRNGILALWKDGCIVWETTLWVNPVAGDSANTVMQNDGNLVTYWKATSASKGDPVWATQTGASRNPQTYTFVIDNCGSNTKVAVYHRNPVTDSNAVRLWSADIDTSCRRRERLLRGSDSDAE